MNAAGSRIRTQPTADWHADYDADDGTLSVTIGVTYSFTTPDLPLDFRPAFGDALWTAFAHIADDEIERVMHRSGGEQLAARLAEVMEPVRDDLERGLGERLSRMTDQLGEVCERITSNGVTR